MGPELSVTDAKRDAVSTPKAGDKKRGISFFWILLATAAIGIVSGTLMGRFTGTDIDELQVVQERQARIFPRGEATKVDVSPDPASIAGIPPYPGVYPRAMTRRANAMGSPMSISWFSTGDSTETVLKYYERAFRAEGRRPFTHRRGEMGYVAWLDAHHDGGLAGGVLHMVSAMKQFNQTIVLVSASRPDMAMNSSPRLPEGFTLPPSATQPQIVQMGEGPASNEVAYSRAVNQSPGAVVEFFARQFKERGFDVLEQSQTPEQGGISATKGSITIVVAVRAEGATDSSIVISYDRQTASPQEELTP